MKKMNRLLFNRWCLVMLLMCISGSSLMAQRHMDSIKVTIAHNFKVWALLQLPDDYKTSNKSYPMILFLHGSHRAGNNLSKLLFDGIPNLLDRGYKLDSKNPADGKIYKFIVITPQAGQWGLNPDQIKEVLDDMQQHYRVDASRIYITGYSAGGSGTVTALTDNPALTRRFAAAAILSPVMLNDKNLHSFKMVADAKVPCWYFAGTAEPHFLRNARMDTDSTNKYMPGLAHMTIHGFRHCCFKEIYKPTYRPKGKNIYEWFLENKRQ